MIFNFTASVIPLVSMCVFVIVTNILYSESASMICQREAHVTEWVKMVAVSVTGAFAFSSIMQCGYLFLSIHSNTTNIYTVANTLVLNIVGGMGSLLNAVAPVTCRDGFGNEIFASQWSSWMVCVPLLTYSYLVVDKSKSPTRMEWGAIISNVCMVLSALFINISGPLGQHVFFLIMATLMFFVGQFFVYRSNVAVKDNESDTKTDSGLDSQSHLALKREGHAITKRSLNYTVRLFLPGYPGIYYLKLFGVISTDCANALYMLLGIVVMGFVGFAGMGSTIAIANSLKSELNAEVASGEARRQFMKYMFHELRMPLNAISLGLECMPKHITRDSSVNDLFSTVKSAVRFTESALDSYLTMLQVDERSFRVWPEEYRVGDLWHSLQKEIKLRFPGDRITFIFEIEASVPTLTTTGDVKLLVSALLALLTRAANRCGKFHTMTVRATLHNGEPVCDRESMTTRHIEQVFNREAPRTLQISFQDCGNALSDVEVHQFFKPYTTLHTGDVMAEHEPGLAHIIAKEVFALHGGSARVSRLPGGGGLSYDIRFQIPLTEEEETRRTQSVGAEGTEKSSIESNIFPWLSPIVATDDREGSLTAAIEFRKSQNDKEGAEVQCEAPPCIFSTPTQNVSDAPQAEKTEVKEDVVKERIGGEDHQLLRLLVVDDAKSNRKLLQRLLVQEGLQSDAAEDGQQAVELTLADNPNMLKYDLIFMDYTMPVMNGVEATRLLRDRGYLGCVVAVTGNAMDSDVQEFLAAGADAIVTKPMTKPKLRQILQCFEGYQQGMYGGCDTYTVIGLIRGRVHGAKVSEHHSTGVLESVHMS